MPAVCTASTVMQIMWWTVTQYISTERRSICELAGNGTVEKQDDWLPDVIQCGEKKCLQRQSRHTNCQELYQMRKETLKCSDEDPVVETCLFKISPSLFDASS